MTALLHTSTCTCASVFPRSQNRPTLNAAAAAAAWYAVHGIYFVETAVLSNVLVGMTSHNGWYSSLGLLRYEHFGHPSIGPCEQVNRCSSSQEERESFIWSTAVV